MKIAFYEISGAEVIRTIADDRWFPHDDIELVPPVSGCLTIRKENDDQASVSGDLQAVVVLPCNRCCEPVQTDISVNFFYNCIVGKEAPETGRDAECREEDYYRIYINEPVIDLDEILREQVFLALPTSLLCRQSCKGLCQQCGADLNKEKCSCDSTDLSSPFAVLRQLKGS